MHHLVLGTAGHIDHGKSSLVKCLTGSDPDRLPEEKARGVTIELGFAHLSLSEGDESFEIGIVDVPGHADFVNNMVAGVGALDLAIFIIAADDGWMPQSEEHLHILTYLGITNIVIALTKADLSDDVPFSVEVLRDELQDTSIAEAPIIPVSSITGEGIDELKVALLKKLHDCQPQQDNAKPRIAIDRIFSPKGAGTVITGTLSGGCISLGDTLTLQPLGLNTKVRYIQSHNESLDRALPGMRTALNLPDLPIDAPGKPGAQRGNTLTTESCGVPTDTLDVELQRLARPIPGIKPRAMRHMETVVLHHGAARCRARVILHGRTHLNPGEKCLAQLRLETPLFLLTGDRVVLRDGSQQSTLGGGIVLDALPTRQGFRTDEHAESLEPRAKAPNDPAVLIRARLKKDHMIDSENPLPNNPFHTDVIKKTLVNLVAEGSISQNGSMLIHTKWWKSQIDEAGKTIRTWHKQHPDLPGMPLENLAKESSCSADLTSQLIEALVEQGYKLVEKSIAHSSHTLTLPDDVADVAKSILDKLNRAGLQPPNKAELTSSAREDQAMKFLIRSGQAIELEPKVVISKNTLEQAISGVRQFITEHQQATASELRQHLDTTRKVVMPLLEHLDAINITVRNDNYRTLK
ncbi:MAG: selenocysteine-specific translation elongation factor [Akkermansiaceae bacterium]|jgi:selenocysteine-specific elongation factor|tara:strand:- start:1594 stop:3498 length:1905 start_codon:yes stop_codon:yes gene_type:complete